MQKSCELGTQYAALEQEKIKLKLDLDLAKENLKKAQDEVAIMGGINLLTICPVIFLFPSFEPSDSTRTKVHSEKDQLQARLRNVISLDKMKQAFEQKDIDLAGAQNLAREKTELADMKVA